MEWEYDIPLFTGPVFACPKEGLFAVIDNRARDLKVQGLHKISHNLLSKSDMFHLYQSESLSKTNEKGFLNRFIFAFKIFTAMRLTNLMLLRVCQFSEMNLDDMVWKITSAIGSLNGMCKTHRGGCKCFGEKPQEIFVWDEFYADGCINFYE